MPVEKEEYEEEIMRQKFVCAVCKELYDDPGMCPKCDLILKKEAE